MLPKISIKITDSKKDSSEPFRISVVSLFFFSEWRQQVFLNLE